MGVERANRSRPIFEVPRRTGEHHDDVRLLLENQVPELKGRESQRRLGQDVGLPVKACDDAVRVDVVTLPAVQGNPRVVPDYRVGRVVARAVARQLRGDVRQARATSLESGIDIFSMLYKLAM